MISAIQALLLLGMILLVVSQVREDIVKMKSGQPGLIDLAWTVLVSVEIGFLVFGIAVLVPLLWTIMK
jgi:hypothetical protein